MGALFDVYDMFIGLNDVQFKSKVSSMKLSEKESLYLAAKDRYYDGNPIMTDSQFDFLEDDLRASKSKIVGVVGGGTDVGGKLIHDHMSPMLSLKKIQVNEGVPFPMQDILSFFKGVFPLEATPKYDGNGIELQYADGKLRKAITRGKNGKGADVTPAMKYIVPEFISSQSTLEIRGEVVMPLDLFMEKYYKEGDGEDNKYANARNMIGGMLGRDDVPVDMVKDSVFVAYSLKAIKAGQVLHVEDAMSNLKKLGFNSQYDVPVLTINNATEITTAYEWFRKYRAEGRMQLDGIVIKMPEALRSKYGENNQYPKWACSIKFPAMLAQTTIKAHTWTVGKTGHLSPLGLLDPVELDGTMVTKASLYNKSKIEEYKTFPGAVVTIRKAGDIIPQVVSVDVPSPNAADMIAADDYYPKNCPSCGTPIQVQKDHDTEHLVCTNHTGCPAQVSRKMANGIAALGIKRIGEATCDSLAKAGIRDIFDFFDDEVLNEANLVRSGEFTSGRSLDIIMTASRSLKEVQLDKVILSLQLPGVGRTVSAEVAKKLSGAPYSFDGLDSSVVAPFNVDTSMEISLIRKLVDQLRFLGVTVSMNQKSGVPFEMTGSPKNSGFKTKEDFIAFMEQHGYMHAKLKDSKMLVCESYSSSSGKMKQAKAKGIEVITYDDIVQKLS